MSIRSLTLFFGVIALSACGDKTPPEAAAEAVVEAPPPEPEPEPEPIVEAVPEPAADNADFGIKVVYGDGTERSGHVRRVERSEDWYGEKGWTDSPMKLTLELEGNGTLKEVNWVDLSTLSLKPGKVPADVDCSYSSEYSPWMYTCAVRTPTAAKTTDGQSWTVNSRHKWRFTLDDGEEIELWLVKYPARMQDERVVSIEDTIGENYDIYTQLQDELRQKVTALPKSITVTQP